MNKLCFVIAVCAFIIAVSAKGFLSDRMFSVVKSVRNIVSSSHAKPSRLLSHATLQSIAQDKKKLGVVLLNLGGPEKLEDVEGFLFNLFADPDIIRLPKALSFLQKPIAYFISKTRASKSKKAYASIGGGSPIVKYTREQTMLLQQALSALPGYESTKCYFAMRYWHPFTEEVLEQMQSDGIDKLVILPLYPHYSISTSSSSLRKLQELFAMPVFAQWQAKHGLIPQTVIPYWYHRPEYIRIMAKLIVEKLHTFTPEELAANEQQVHVLFSAHGVPEYYITREHDPYQQHIQHCVQLIETEVRQQLLQQQSHHHHGGCLHGVDVTKLSFHLSFQSRVGPVKWLQPYTDDMLVTLGKKQGVKNLVVIPISFVSEHIETLEEIDQEYQELAHEQGIVNWKRVPALNVHEEFIDALKDIVVDAVESFPVVSIEEAMNLAQMEKYQQYQR